MTVLHGCAHVLRDSAIRILLATCVALFSSQAHTQSLHFNGNGVNDIDRVKIRIDDPNSYTDAGVPADVGATDFTIEVWLRPTSGNAATRISCGSNNNWISGNIFLDRDRYGQGRSFGLSLSAGQVAFGVTNSSRRSLTLCGGPDLRDGGWHHVAVQRRRSDGYLWLFVDGQLRAQGTGPDGDVSYPDDGVPANLCGSRGTSSCSNSDPFIVLGAEKHDYDSRYYPAYRGGMDELRISRVLRYSGSFAVPARAFSADGNTAALYHFDEGSGNDVIDWTSGNRSPGVRRYGGNPAGPVWSTDTPFTAAPTGQINFVSSSYVGAEGGGTVSVAVSRSGGSSGAASIDYAIVDGTARAGADFAPVAGTLRWSAGESGERTFSIAPIDDTAVENRESAQLQLSNAIGADLGTRPTAILNLDDNDTMSSPDSSGAGNVLDAFSRADSATIGNGWIEKNAGAFSLAGGRAIKLSTGSTDYRNNLLYRPTNETLTNVEASVEFRLNSGTVGYPMIVTRLQNASATSSFSGYLLSIPNATTRAAISRQNGAGWDSILATFTLSSALNTSDTYRLRLRTIGTNPVTLQGYVERLNGSSWQSIGSASFTDSSSSRISTGGTIGLSGDVESGYSFDNVRRVEISQ